MLGMAMLLLILGIILGAVLFMVLAGDKSIPFAFGGGLGIATILLTHFAQSIPKMLVRTRREVWTLSFSIALIASFVFCWIFFGIGQ
jgi:hypothetical protein